VEPAGRGPGIIEQRAFARFVEAGLFDRHLRRLRQRLLARQEAALDALDRHADGRLAAATVAAGRHLVVQLRDPGLDARRIVTRAAEAGVRLGRHDEVLLLGFAGAEPDRLIEGVRRLVRILDRAPAESPRGPIRRQPAGRPWIGRATAPARRPATAGLYPGRRGD
jgi:DNA-binding transcriptional MocR family regulator